MAQIDGSIDEYTTAELMADRIDAFRIATRLVTEAAYVAQNLGLQVESVSTADIIEVTSYLVKDIH